MGWSIVACGKQETTAGKESINETVESVQEETTETDDAESTVRGVKLGDSIDKVFEYLSYMVQQINMTHALKNIFHMII